MRRFMFLAEPVLTRAMLADILSSLPSREQRITCAVITAGNLVHTDAIILQPLHHELLQSPLVPPKPSHAYPQ